MNFKTKSSVNNPDSAFDSCNGNFSVGPKLLSRTSLSRMLKTAIAAVYRTSSSAIAERPRDARVTSIRKIANWNF